MTEQNVEKVNRRKMMQPLRVCGLDHGGPGNSVYGHFGSMRTCIRLFDSDNWVYDPRWETPSIPSAEQEER